MSIFTIKRHLLFVRIVCCLFIWYNIQNFYHHYNAYQVFSKPLHIGSIYGWESNLIIWLSSQGYYTLWALIVVGIVNAAGIAVAILVFKNKLTWLRLLIIMLYATIVFNVLNLLRELAFFYVIAHLRRNYIPTSWNFYRFWYEAQPALGTFLFIVILFWIIKQFKSEPVRNLLQQKSAPEISGTL